MTVQELRNNGYKVKVLHYRNPSTTALYSPKGGKTRLIIDSPTGEHFEGEAICSKKDNYNKRLGIQIALGRSGVLFCEHKTNNHS